MFPKIYRFALFSTLLLLFSMALANASSSAQEQTDALPRLWREQPPPAYVPPRPGQVWRSLRMPRADIVADLLRSNGRLPLSATPEETRQAVKAWYRQAHKNMYVGPDPAAFRQLQAREQSLLHGSDVRSASLQAEATPLSILGVTVAFSGTDRVTRLYPAAGGGGCVETEFQFQPLAFGQDPPPGPRDNFSFYKEDIGPADYNAALFGIGPDAPGYGVVRPDLGGIDLTGLTLNNYLLEMSRGQYQVQGSVLTDTVQAPHAAEYYGYALYQENAEGVCAADPASDAHFIDFVQDAIAATRAHYGNTIDWSRFDSNGDHVIDLFFIIHAGYGWQDGGSEDRLSSSSSTFSGAGLEPPQISGQDTPDTADDYFIDAFAVFPEQLDLGAMQEELAHQFGLPDLYTLDAENSNGYWGALSAGVWGGQVGGSRPVGQNLWQDWLLGWRHPRVINYDDPEAQYILGRARQTPADTEDGLIIQLPPKEFRVDNKAGAGNGWWSGADNSIDHRVWRAFDLSSANEGLVFSFDAYWDIEKDWDYGYIEVSTDNGATWTTLPDQEGHLVATNPNGLNLGWGLTGQGQGRLRFDLSAYRGGAILLRFRYLTDPTTAAPGWWVDNLSLDDAGGNLYANALETDFSDWTNQGWIQTPFNKKTDQFYLVEWRDDNGFDQSLQDPYQIVFLNKENHETKINRLPATTPGLLITYRDTDEPFDHELMSSLAKPPSYGPKYGLLVVDSHFQPTRFDTTSPNYQDGWVGVPVSGRVAPGDALFGLQPTRAWSARLGFDFDSFTWQETPIETKSWPGQPPVPAFHDALGYTPGFFYPGTGSLIYLHDWDASVVLPARGDYTTPVTWPNGSPSPSLYGIEVAPGRALGTGQPGDNQVQYGLHIQVMEGNHEQAVVRVWNAMYELDGAGAANTESAANGEQVDFTFVVRNVGSAGDFFGFVPLPPGVSYVPNSVTGDFFPIGGPVAAIQSALAHGDRQALRALAAPAGVESPASVSGFGYLGHLNSAESMTGGFSVLLDSVPVGQKVTTQLTFYQDGAPFRSFSSAITARNTPPAVHLTPAQTTLEEGDLFQAAGSFSDVDADTWSATVDYGDGDGPQTLAFNADKTFTLGHTYANEGEYTVTVTVSDGHEESVATLAVSVANAPPVVTLPAAATLDEGETLLVSGAFTDPGQDVWSATVDYGDGGPPQPLTLDASNVFTLEHRFDRDGQFDVEVRVDDGSAVGTAIMPVQVANVPPVVEPLNDVLLGVDEGYRVQGRFHDPGADVWSATVDYGEGDPPATLQLGPDQTFQLDHQYAAPGVYTVTVTVRDDSGATGASSARVSVFTTVELPLLADTWVHAGAPTTNYDAYAALILFTTGLDNALLSFDRSPLPAGAAILKAELSLRVNFESGATGKRLSVLNVAAFDPETVTFADQPTYFNPDPGQVIPEGLGEMRFDVTSQVANWDMLSGQPYQGATLGQLAVAATGPYAGRIAIDSLESWPPGHHAKLWVTFVP